MTGWCSWHRGEATEVVAVRVVEQGSGPGLTVYACPACCRMHRLTPIGRSGTQLGGQPEPHPGPRRP